jgi:hypothetical protein
VTEGQRESTPEGPTVPSPESKDDATQFQILLVFLNVYIMNPQAYEIIVVAFTLKYSGYRIFHREKGISSS